VADSVWQSAMMNAETAYFDMLHYTTPQIARDVLPLSVATKMVVTYNLRQWRHVFLMRTTKETHPAFKAIMIYLLRIFQERIPLLYDDIQPDNLQRVNIAKEYIVNKECA
jgi:thymidylate synthase (FAD)